MLYNDYILILCKENPAARQEALQSELPMVKGRHIAAHHAAMSPSTASYNHRGDPISLNNSSPLPTMTVNLAMRAHYLWLLWPEWICPAACSAPLSFDSITWVPYCRVHQRSMSPTSAIATTEKVHSLSDCMSGRKRAGLLSAKSKALLGKLAAEKPTRTTFSGAVHTTLCDESVSMNCVLNMCSVYT